MASSVVESAAAEATELSGGAVASIGSPSRPVVAEGQELDTDLSLWRKLWEGWKRVGKKIGNFQARLLLALFYAIFLAPFALMLRWLSDPLAIKPGSKRGWLPRSEQPDSKEQQAKRQF